MHITAVEEYGLRCALQLARSAGQGPLAASQVAEREGISVEYASKLLHLFKKAGLVQGMRGVQGGFVLSRAPSEVTLKEVLDAMRSKKDLVSDGGFCSHFSGQAGQCVNFECCSVRPVWSVVTSYFDHVLKRLTLNDLVARENEAKEKVHQVAREAAERVTGRLIGEESFKIVEQEGEWNVRR